MASSRQATSLRDAIDSLSESLRLRQTVLVVGPDALRVTIADEQGRTTEGHFYRLVARRLLEQYGLPAELVDEPGEGWDLHRATAAILSAQDTPPQRLRRSVSAVIRDLAARARPAEPLARLARLDTFDLVVCLTPDDLLQQAVRTVRGDAVEIEVTSYSTRSDIGQQIDIAAPRPGTLRLFHPLGRAEAATEFAIHEEDALEYLYRFRDEGERRAKTLLTTLRENDRLFLGCALPDWLGRGLVRLANDQRLSASERPMEFFCACAQDEGLNGFFDRFSPNSIVFPWLPAEFTAELERISSAFAPGTPGRAVPAAPAVAAARGPGRRPSAFVSYASEDVEAARLMADALQQAGFGEVWLDKRRLGVGDEWSGHIAEAIAGCDYFVALLSRQADARRTGVFWEEWRLAIAQSLRVADNFILPIGVDPQPPQQAGYQRIFNGVTRSLADLHLGHAPQGRPDRATLDQLRQLTERFAAGRV